jgi:glycosyltransferase involved in cell wall biosynthesis
MNPSISCILPVYNGERFVAEALDSVFNQTLKPDQVIVVDDGSTDGTADVVKRFRADIVYVRQDNAGPAAARNRGLRDAYGDFVSFIDADDLWRPEKLERQVHALARNPTAGYCLTLVQNFWTKELAAERERLSDHAFAKPMVGFVLQCLLARRDLFYRQVGLLDETRRIGEDTDWFLRADNAGVEKAILQEVLVDRRVHGGNISFEVYSSQKAKQDIVGNVMTRLAQRRAQELRAKEQKT